MLDFFFPKTPSKNKYVSRLTFLKLCVTSPMHTCEKKKKKREALFLNKA